MIFTNIKACDVRKEYRKIRLHSIGSFLLGKLKSILGTIGSNIQVLWNKAYSKLYKKKKIIFRAGIGVLLAIEIVLAALVCISFYNKQTVDYEMIVLGVLAIAIFVGMYLFCKAYYLLAGKYSVLAIERTYFIEYVQNVLAHIVKISGRTGGFKDTLMSAFDNILSHKHYNNIMKIMHTASEIAYMFDFEKIQSLILADEAIFKTCSDEINELQLIQLMKKNCLIKKRYRKIHSQQMLVNDYLTFKENKAYYTSKYVYDVGTDKTHFFSLVVAYCTCFKRLAYAPIFSMSNQPMKASDGMAKQFSFNFTKLTSDTICDKNRRINYRSVTVFPWTDNLTITETEGDSWYLNVDKKNASEMASSGNRDFRAYIRHLLGENTYWFSTGQDSGRMQKLIRELDHCYVEVLQHSIIDGGAKRRLVLEPLYKMISYILATKESSRARKNAKIDTKIEFSNKYRLLYLTTSKLKYKEKYMKYQSLKHVDSSLFEEFLIRKRKILKQKIEQLKNEGYIKVGVLISDKPQPVNCEKIDLEDCISDERPLYKRSYITQFTFLKKDTWGRFDTHYLKSIKEVLAKNSKLTFYDIPSWSESMKMTKEDAINMGYTRLDSFYDVSSREKGESFAYEQIN